MTAALRSRPAPARSVKNSTQICAGASESFSAALSVAFQQAAARGEGSLQMAHALSESIVELGQRLGTIQLLRDKFYRACEAYANGAISATSYTLLLSRLDRTMTTMMLAEMAAGALTRSSAAAGGTANAGTGPKVADVEKAAKAVADAKTDAAAKEKTRDDAKTKRDDAQKTATADPSDANKKALATAQADLDRAYTELDAASRTVQSLETELRDRVVFAASSATAIPGKGATQVPSDEVVKTLAVMQQQYLDVDDFSTVLDACITSMDGVRAPDATALAEMRRTNVAVATAKKTLDEAMAKKALPDIEAARAKLSTARATAAAAVAQSDLSLFGTACNKTVLENLQDILKDGRAAQRFKVGLPRDIAQFEACKVALASSDENVRNAGIRCMKDLERPKKAEVD